MMKRLCLLSLLSLGLLTGCVTAPPREMDNVCSIFHQYPDWYQATRQSEKRWGVPIAVQMAVMHQESHFDATAKPPRTKLLGFIPWTRPTTAYGYSQALDGTWDIYRHDTGQYLVSRDNFADASDFIGWYSKGARERAGIQPNDPFRFYLAYHEGVGGFQQKTYLNKAWLVDVAKKVKDRAKAYHSQLRGCEKKLTRRTWGWSIFG